MKNKKALIGILITVAVIAAAVTLAIIYKEEVLDTFNKVKDKVEEKRCKYFALDECDECEDYAD